MRFILFCLMASAMSSCAYAMEQTALSESSKTTAVAQISADQGVEYFFTSRLTKHTAHNDGKFQDDHGNDRGIEHFFARLLAERSVHKENQE